MISANIAKLPSLLFLFLLILTGCVATTTRVKNPSFSRPIDSIQFDLNQIVSCESMNLSGTEKTSNGQKNTELEMRIINGKNIPTDETRIDSLAKKIALVLKVSLQDKNEYDVYQVMFVNEKLNGPVTQSTSNGKIFKSADL